MKLKSFFRRFSHFTCSPIWFCAFPFFFAYAIEPTNLIYTIASSVALILLVVEFILMLLKVYPASVFPKWMSWANTVSFWGTIAAIYFLTSGEDPIVSPLYKSQMSQILFIIGLCGTLILIGIIGFKRCMSEKSETSAVQSNVR